MLENKSLTAKFCLFPETLELCSDYLNVLSLEVDRTMSLSRDANEINRQGSDTNFLFPRAVSLISNFYPCAENFGQEL